jgi:hypothetical protein
MSSSGAGIIKPTEPEAARLEPMKEREEEEEEDEA